MKDWLATIAGRIRRQSTPALSDEEVQRALAASRSAVAREVAAGFSSVDEIASLAAEIAADDAGVRLPAQAFTPLIEAVVAEHLEEEKAWPAVTDCDRLDAAFAELEKAGIIARQNFSCCGTCGVGEIADEMNKAATEEQH